MLIALGLGSSPESGKMYAHMAWQKNELKKRNWNDDDDDDDDDDEYDKNKCESNFCYILVLLKDE